MPDLHGPTGGSLNHLALAEHTAVKTYAGTDGRGHEKLRREFTFLSELPPAAARHFAMPTHFFHCTDPPLTRLELVRVRDPAVAKSILLGRISPARTGEIAAEILRVLHTDLYPIRSRPMTGRQVYEEFHAGRVRRALSALRGQAELAELIDAPKLGINGLECPSVGEATAWLDQHWHRFHMDCTAVAAHGDPHLDNVLAPVDGPLRITLVDPRGDVFLPPSYDFAKILKAARDGYDCIHYNQRVVKLRRDDSALHAELSVEQAYTDCYRAVLHELLGALPSAARAQGVTEREFIASVLASEFTHIVSFAYYHLGDPSGYDPERVTSYLLVASLLARDLMSSEGESGASLLNPVLTPPREVSRCR